MLENGGTVGTHKIRLSNVVLYGVLLFLCGLDSSRRFKIKGLLLWNPLRTAFIRVSETKRNTITLTPNFLYENSSRLSYEILSIQVEYRRAQLI